LGVRVFPTQPLSSVQYLIRVGNAGYIPPSRMLSIFVGPRVRRDALLDHSSPAHLCTITLTRPGASFFHRIPEIEKEAGERGEGRRLPLTIGLLSFESPRMYE
jgi:hypothetical protein